MFLRRYVRTKAGKKHVYFALVESVRTDAGPRQRVVAHLGELNANQERRWQRTVVFYNRHGDAQQMRLFPDDDLVPLPDDPDIVRVRVDDVSWTNARRFGDVYLARWLWNLLDLDTIVNRHVPQGKETVRPVDVVAIEVINRLCAPCSEFALAEHWYASTALEDLLGVPDGAVTKDRLYHTLDQFLKGQIGIENDVKDRFQGLFKLEYEVLLYDLTSSYFEGLAEENDLAKRGYSRDHRGDCKQIVLAMVVSREGFPLAHYTMVGNTKDVQTVRRVVGEIEARFGKAQRVWVMDRGMISEDTLTFLSEPERRYVLATRRHELTHFQEDLGKAGWQSLPEHPGVAVKALERQGVYYLLARSNDRKKKERAIRRRQRRPLAAAIHRLQARIAKGRLKNRDKMAEAIGRLKSRFPKAAPFVNLTIHGDKAPLSLQVEWKVDKFKDALRRDGAYLLRSNQGGWTAEQFWETYMQLTAVERAFRVLKSELLLRPIWHHYSGRTQAHVFVCVLAYALWKTLDHLAKQAGLQTLIHKPSLPAYGNAVPKPRPMTPEVILRELGQIMIGDIELATTDGRRLLFRRVARPNAEQKRILDALGIIMPERMSEDRIL
jgi:DDE family transposase